VERFGAGSVERNAAGVSLGWKEQDRAATLELEPAGGSPDVAGRLRRISPDVVSRQSAHVLVDIDDGVASVGHAGRFRCMLGG
jgi:hypothetical protein